jgi:hypothetical protein
LKYVNFLSFGSRRMRNHFGIPVEKVKRKLSFLGGFAKLRKLSISSHWTYFDETWYSSFFRKSVEKMQVSLKFDKNNGYFTWRRLDIFDDISLSCSYNEKCFRQKLERKWKHILCSITFFRKLHRLWDNVEKYFGARRATNDVKIWCMRFACCISKTICTYAHAHVYAFSYPTCMHARARMHTQTNK